MLSLDDQVCRRAVQYKRRYQMAVPVKDPKPVTSSLTDKYSFTGRISLQKSDDAAACHPRNERIGLEEIRINARLSLQGLIRQCVGGMLAIIPDNLLPVLFRDRVGKDH